MDRSSRQCGGVPGLGTEVPVLAVQLLREWAHSTKQCIGLLFVDAKEAFYAIVRTLVVPKVESDEAVAYLFNRLGLPPQAMDELRERLQQRAIFTDLELPPAITTDIASTYTGTYFTMQGSEEIGIALKGTRPGHPYADIIFAFAFQQVLSKLASQLDRLRLRPQVPTYSLTEPFTRTGYTSMPIPAFLLMILLCQSSHPHH